MKIMTILGTRPEIIRLSRIIPLLDSICEQILVNTSQNYDFRLNALFFEELGLRQPDYQFNCQSADSMEQIAAILAQCERIINCERPDRVLILGDTNSALSAIAAKRKGIAVFHMEAGNRCYDDRVPEEVNRRIVDHCSDILLPYTERSRANLLREGIPGHRIFVTGNPILEVLNYYREKIEASTALKQMGVQANKYFLVTLHRAENVDVDIRRDKLINALKLIHAKYKFPLICSLHPRTRSQLTKNGQIMDNEGIIAVEPLGLFDFIKLEKQAFCILTDSGTVQEECCLFNIPSVTLRDVTERPETVECGSSIIAGCEPAHILAAVDSILKQACLWEAPREYQVKNVSSTIAKIIMGNLPQY
jgi:UDP-N-acetylglucosamine 2-epimerase (non-hydrolysing)